MSKKNENLNMDFQIFVYSKPVSFSLNRSDAILKKIKGRINPKPHMVFIKVMIANMVIGFLSLSVCHQFGLNPFNTDKSLEEWFMGVGGHNLCMTFCGILFLSLGVFLAGFFLTEEEVRVLKKNQFVHIPALGLISLILLGVFGAELVFHFAALWLLGAFFGGWLATRSIYFVKVIHQ
ncbi:hypothetical protein [Bdellovibrio bacteriovorus]|uniref:hypothetical protein n=1 Tax=Bdellovibrio bacteriovorus TaxID=959 RepID=UPI0035A612D8